MCKKATFIILVTVVAASVTIIRGAKEWRKPKTEEQELILELPLAKRGEGGGRREGSPAGKVHPSPLFWVGSLEKRGNEAF